MPQASVLKRGQVQNLSCVNDFYYHAHNTLFHEKGFALGLVLRVRVFGTRKWPVGSKAQDFLANFMIILYASFSSVI